MRGKTPVSAVSMVLSSNGNRPLSALKAEIRNETNIKPELSNRTRPI